jgi:hypothetical protein
MVSWAALVKILEPWRSDLIALAGLAVALYALRDSTRQSKAQVARIEESVAKLEAVRQALRTKALGPFPNFMAQIVSAVESAQRTLYIACDVPAYAMFSARPQFTQYLFHLDNKKKLEIHFVCLDATRRRELHERQFSQPWERLLENADFSSRVTELARRTNRSRIAGAREFAEVVEEQNLEVLRTRIAPAVSPLKPLETAVAMPVYMWIADDKYAVFAFSVFNDETVSGGGAEPDARKLVAVDEFGFETEDAEMIRALKGIWLRYESTASECAVDVRPAKPLEA